MNGWYENGRQSLYKMGHKWENTWTKKVLEKTMQAMAAQIKLFLHRDAKVKIQGVLS